MYTRGQYVETPVGTGRIIVPTSGGGPYTYFDLDSSAGDLTVYTVLLDDGEVKRFRHEAIQAAV